MTSGKILYCVLNWGLGHATRSIPVIKALISRGHHVEIASDGGPLTFLQNTFPDVTCHSLPSYNIVYPTKSVLLNAATQMRKMLRAVTEEQQAIKDLMAEHAYRAIISDNRYGCYVDTIPSILITHQLSNLTKSSLMSRPGEWIVSRYLKDFDEVWVPDFPDRKLTGKMTEAIAGNVRYVGYLSDQEKRNSSIEFEVAAILSGPEPQRTNLEEEILPQLKSFPGTCAFARGVITDTPPQTEGDLTIYPYLNREGVNRMLNSASVIVCRTGYSSLMDLMQTGTKALLIPTPGQPEQVYLGEQLRDHPQFVVQKQGSVNIAEAVNVLLQREQVQHLPNSSDLLLKAIQHLESVIKIQD